MILVIGTQKLGPAVINGGNSDAIDTEGAHAVTIGDIPSLEWFQAIPNE